MGVVDPAVCLTDGNNVGVDRDRSGFADDWRYSGEEEMSAGGGAEDGEVGEPLPRPVG